MAFFSKVGNILKHTASRRISCESSVSNLSIYQAIRCMSSSKVFIGGLSYSMDDNSLREAFAKYGYVNEASIIMDRDSGRSRGFGFVTFNSGEEASSAIQALDGQELHGRRVTVNYATEKSRASGFGGGGGGYGGSGYGGSGFGGGYGGNSGGYGSGRNASYDGAGDSMVGNNGGYGSGSGNYGVAGGAGGGFDGNTGFGNFSGGSGGIDTGFDGNTGARFGGSDESGSSMGGAAGGFDQDGPLDGNFRDEDDTGDFAKRA